VKEGQKIVYLFIVENSLEWGHIATASFDRLAHVLVRCRHSAWKIRLPEDTNERWPLQRLVLVWVVTNSTVRLKEAPAMLFLNGQGTPLARRL